MPKISVTTLIDRAKTEYEDYEIDGIDGGPVVFHNPWNLDDDKRAEFFSRVSIFQELQDASDKTEEELKQLFGPGITAMIKNIFELVSTPQDVNRFLKAINKHLPTMFITLRDFTEAIQPGEASRSVSS